MGEAALHRSGTDQDSAGLPAAAGVEGNSRLTSTTGLLLLVLLAVEGVTVLRVRQLITLHVYLGLILLGPVALKTATTVYRFARYYGGSAPYVHKGPPHLVLRLLGPVVIVTSLTLLGSGVVLILRSGDGGLWLTVHKASFFVWFAAMTVHVLGHLREALVASYEELRASGRDRAVRLALVVVSLALGVGLAAALYPSASSWTSGHDRHDRHEHAVPRG